MPRRMLEVITDMEATVAGLETWASEVASKHTVPEEEYHKGEALVDRWVALKKEFETCTEDPGEDTDEAERYLAVVDSYTEIHNLLT